MKPLLMGHASPVIRAQMGRWGRRRMTSEIELLREANAELYAALVRVLPMVRACNSENYSDLQGNEDTRTAALKNALTALTKANGEPAAEGAGV